MGSVVDLRQCFNSEYYFYEYIFEYAGNKKES